VLGLVTAAAAIARLSWDFYEANLSTVSQGVQ
jgi:hypothetical protein